MPLPPGYTVTTVAGLTTLWHNGHCVTVQSADVSDEVLAEIAGRHTAYAPTRADTVPQADAQEVPHDPDQYAHG